MATLRRELEIDPALQEQLLPLAAERTIQLALKRTFDLTAALLLILVLAIPALVVALVVRIDSRGAPILRQWRVGKYGRLFIVYKFRTMCDRADEMVHALADQNDQAGTPLFKMRRDPRLTRVGRILRKTSLDELPQLINVLRGEMSLVGPRPPLPREVQVYTQRQLRRLGAKPGMTGLWQISGRSDLSFDQMVDLDIRYIDTWSFAGDLAILARTLPAVVSTRGAY